MSSSSLRNEAMKAMILAAGLGTRLRPWTDDKPKALVQYNHKPLLQWVIEKLKLYGFDQIIINVHHFADQIIDFVNKNNAFDIEIVFSDERDELLDTGGGIKKAQWYLQDVPFFLVYNVDILSEIDLHKLVQSHKKDAIATLAVQKRPTSRTLLFDNQSLNLCGWKNKSTGAEKIINNCNNYIEFAFSGIHLISTKIFDFLPYGKYSIISAYLDIAQKHLITFFDHSNDQWRDMGLKQSYESSLK